MEGTLKYLSGLMMGALSFFAPVRGLVICVVVFVGIDFVTGVAASYKRAKREGRDWGFQSAKAWDTIIKLAFVMAGVVLAWLIDTHILSFVNLRLANIFTGFVCGVEFWSYLENAAEISQHPVFRGVKKIMKKKLDKALDIEAEQGEGSDE